MKATNNSSLIRTLRLDEKLDSFVVNDAKENRLSINAAYNQILDRYVNCFRLVDKLPCLVIPCDVIRDFLYEIPEDKVKKLGKIFGSYLPKHSLFLKGEGLTTENVLEFMKTTCQDSNWYQFNIQNNNGTKNVLLRHGFGRNWSIFLNEYYHTIFKEVLNVKMNSEIGDGSLVITMKK
ncbi:MAG: hypothetical protein ACOWW1_10020 [archaeon]